MIDLTNPDSLFEQMANISKASAYDIVSKQVKELQAENEALKDKIRELTTPYQTDKFLFHVGEDLLHERGDKHPVYVEVSYKYIGNAFVVTSLSFNESDIIYLKNPIELHTQIDNCITQKLNP